MIDMYRYVKVQEQKSMKYKSMYITRGRSAGFYEYLFLKQRVLTEFASFILSIMYHDM